MHMLSMLGLSKTSREVAIAQCFVNSTSHTEFYKYTTATFVFYTCIIDAVLRGNNGMAY